MTENEREQLLALVPHMRRIPGRAQALLEQVQVLRRVLVGEGVGLGEYVAAIEREIAMLEDDARGLAQVAGLIEGLLEWIENGQK